MPKPWILFSCCQGANPAWRENLRASTVPENTHARGRSGHSFVHENVASAPSKTSLQRHRPLLPTALVQCGPTSRGGEKMCLFPRHPPPVCRAGAGAEPTALPSPRALAAVPPLSRSGAPRPTAAARGPAPVACIGKPSLAKGSRGGPGECWASIYVPHQGCRRISLLVGQPAQVFPHLSPFSCS